MAGAPEEQTGEAVRAFVVPATDEAPDLDRHDRPRQAVERVGKADKRQLLDRTGAVPSA